MTIWNTEDDYGNVIEVEEVHEVSELREYRVTSGTNTRVAIYADVPRSAPADPKGDAIKLFHFLKNEILPFTYDELKQLIATEVSNANVVRSESKS
jgi:hypothetical protein